jgi:hypothetical protein
MEPQEDPEKRIRDLERPLAETARASELGGVPSGGHAYPPPPPGPVPPPPPPGSVPPPPTLSPYNYGTAFPGTTPRSSSGSRAWWILAALFVVGVLALVGGIAGYVANRSKTVLPSAGPGTSQFRSAPRTAPRNPNPTASGTQLPGTGPSNSPLPPGSPLTVTGMNENTTIACNDNIVTVTGQSNTVVITGHCVSLIVVGINNTITVDAVDTIDASGLNNQVTYHSGSPQVTKTGDGNDIHQG